MKGQEMKKYRENVEISQNKLSVKSHIAQNTLSQYETEKRMMDYVTDEHLLSHLRVSNISQKFQLTNKLVRNLTKSILEEDALEYWANEVKTKPENQGNDVLLNGGQILIRCFTENALAYIGEGYAILTLENLFLGFKQWLVRSSDFVKDQVDRMEDEEIILIDEIGINEICQYALFNDLLFDLPK
jgi:transcriptional regulator with XRE-family HTH domain